MDAEKAKALIENANPIKLIWTVCFIARLAAGHTMKKTEEDAEQAMNMILNVLAGDDKETGENEKD